jgi:hypothetical protein
VVVKMPQSLQFFFRKGSGRIVNTVTPVTAPGRPFAEVIPEIATKFGLDSHPIIRTREEYTLTARDLETSVGEIVKKFGNVFELIPRKI